jgi:hypothetical protein
MNKYIDDIKKVCTSLMILLSQEENQIFIDHHITRFLENLRLQSMSCFWGDSEEFKRQQTGEVPYSAKQLKYIRDEYVNHLYTGFSSPLMFAIEFQRAAPLLEPLRKEGYSFYGVNLIEL